MKKVLVIGLGISGLAVVNFCLKRGFLVTAVDRILPSKFDSCEVFLDDHNFEVFDFDLVVASPGVPPENLIYKRAVDEGVELVSEAELALREIRGCTVIGVTGSNGKSTTVMQIAHILNENKIKARALGNIGTPLISVIDEIEVCEVIVSELSSFQLERMSSKVFDMSMILNVAPNHLDRHSTMGNYFLAKRKIGECLKEKGSFAIGKEVAIDYGEFLCGFNFVEFSENSEFVRFACMQLGLSDEQILYGLKSFKSLPHRLEYVRDILGIHCYNDSKATTMEAVSHGVRTIGRDIVLIAGGRHKGGSFSVWNESFPGIVKAIILIGEAKELIFSELKLPIPILFETSLEKAIEKGLQVACRGDNLVLSPGCSSYDMFLNFEKRGEAFKRGLECESKRYDPDCCSC